MVAVPELRNQLKGPHVNIGEHTYASSAITALGFRQYPITIGRYCSFAWGVEFMVTGGHYMDCVSTYPFDNIDAFPEANKPLRPYHKGLEINIGNDVWICCHAKILHDSPIGDGAVIGAYSVVRGPVRPYAVVIGNPAVEVARRFDDETVDKLLELKWWDWDESLIRKHMDLITSPPDMEKLCSMGS